MVDNRMFLVCRTDREYFCLGIYTKSSSWKISDLNFLKAYSKFLEDHTHKHGANSEDFELIYENDSVIGKTSDESVEGVVAYSRVPTAVRSRK